MKEPFKAQNNNISKRFNLRNLCHVNTNENDDRFVGIKVEKDSVNVFFPIGYDLPNNETELRKDIKNLMTVISTYTDKTERISSLDSFGSAKSVNVPFQAYCFILSHFIQNNCHYYVEKTFTYKKDSKGKINWKKTIKKQRPYLQNEEYLYLNHIVQISKLDHYQLITQIHKYIVFESYEHFGWLYPLSKPSPSNIFFDKKLFLSTINSKLQHTNNDQDKKLFHAMKAVVECCDCGLQNKRLCYGTDKFEVIWEKLINTFFGISNKDDYFPHAVWEEHYGNNKRKRCSALEPDTIMLMNNNFYVLDAKYYRYGTHHKLSSLYLPQSSDINKQITYGEYVHNNKIDNGEVYNAFILPYNKNNNQFGVEKNFLNVAEATGDWLGTSSHLKPYERVQAIVVDTRYILTNYEGSHYLDKQELMEEIECYIN